MELLRVLDGYDKSAWLSPRKAKESLERTGIRGPVEPLLPLLGEHSSIRGSRTVVEKRLSLATAKAILAIGGYEHADVLRKMVERDPPAAGGHIFEHLDEAIRYKLEGFDFKVHFEKGHAWETEATHYGGGKTGHAKEELSLFRGDKLSN